MNKTKDVFCYVNNTMNKTRYDVETYKAFFFFHFLIRILDRYEVMSTKVLRNLFIVN